MFGKRRNYALATLVVFFLLNATAGSVRAERLAVVATFSVLGDMVSQIGGDKVSVTTLVGPNGDTHMYQPTPAAAGAVAKAQMLVINGLDYDKWIERLRHATNFKGLTVTATEGIKPLESDEHHSSSEEKHDREHAGHEKGHNDAEDHGDKHSTKHNRDEHQAHKETDHDGHHHGVYDPHAWHDPVHGQAYARNIADGLSTIDPANTAYYRSRLTNYVNELAALDAEIESRLSQVPVNRRTVITSHDALHYFGRAYGLRFLAPQGLSTESEPSAEGVAHLIRQIRKQRITAVFVQNLGDPRLVKQIAAETGATLGGTLYTDALSPVDGPASTYLDMLRSNATVLHDALRR